MARISKTDAALNTRIRDWAASRGLPCPDRGPIPTLIRQAYQQAHDCTDPPARFPDRAVAPGLPPA
jgi:hypothetical protein